MTAEASAPRDRASQSARDSGPASRQDTVSLPEAAATSSIAPDVRSWSAATARRIAAATSWRRAAIAAASGAVSTLAFAPFHAWPVLLMTLPALVWLLDGAVQRHTGRARVWSAAAAGWWFGFGFHFVGLHWVGQAFLVEAEVFAWLLPFAVTLLPAGLAIFHAAAAAMAVVAWRSDLGRVGVLALALTASEWLRGHAFTGFPWNVLGYALTGDLVTMQSAAVLGIYGLTLVTVIVAAGPLVGWVDAERRRPGSRSRWFGITLAAGIYACQLGFGLWRLSAPPPAAVADVRLRVVQPSIPQHEKWRPQRQREFFERHLDLSGKRPDGVEDGLAGITHVIWAEASMPFQPLASPQARAMIAARIPATARLLAGALRSEDRPTADGGQRRHAFNSLLDFAPGGKPAAIYDKIHLVPFGEYLPFQATLEAIGLEQLTRVRGGFSIGPRPRPLMMVPGLPPIGPLICYEAIFPAAVVQGSERPGMLVNATNDGWFGTLTGPYQHFHQSRLRAVEEGVPLIRASNNGVSAIIDAHGRVLQRIGLDVAGTIDGPLPGAIAPPPYARFGDLIALALWLTLAGALLCVRRDANGA